MAESLPLAEKFRRLGAPNPEAWARSQEQEGIPQLARFFFLQQAWERVVPRGDIEWIDGELGHAPDIPGGAISPALRRLLDIGADKQDITTVVRTMQWQLLFRLCYLLDGPGYWEDFMSDMNWRLFQIDEEGNPIVPIEGLHESVLETEPSGTEMIG